MNRNYFGTPLAAEQLQRQQLSVTQHQRQQRQQRQHQQQQQQEQQQRRQLGNVGNVRTGGMVGQMAQDDPMSAITDSPMLDGDSLDEIIRNNSSELHRRRSITQPYSPGTMNHNGRRLSMLEYGNTDVFTRYQYDNMGSSLQNASADENFDSMGNSRMSGISMSNSGQFTHSSNMDMMGMPDANGFTPLSPEMFGSMMAFSALNMNAVTTAPPSMGLFSQPSLGDHYMSSSMTVDSMGSDNFAMDIIPNGLSKPRESTAMMQQQDRDSEMVDSGQSFPPAPEPRANPNMQSKNPGIPQNTTQTPTFKTPALANPPLPTSTQQPSPASTMAGGPAQPPSKYKNIYSKTGFDMVRALFYVSSRANPQINLGPVDMSCSFVISDLSLNDCPIVYVSHNFQVLTGYSQHEIVGKNCRFLQAPDGKVEAGVKREFVEDHAVFKLKKAIAERQEIQQSLINYRKGGKPFLNLLTMIPIPWDGPDFRYYVGFQIDLVDCPDAIAQSDFGGGGAFKVDYSTKIDIDRPFVWPGPDAATAAAASDQDSSQTLSPDDVSTLLKQTNPKGLASDWHRQAWDKMLLENSDDVVHVLSLKGTFLYLSPSCKKVLEYDAAELVGPRPGGNTLEAICHPCDAIRIGRDLKDAKEDNPIVSLVFRIQQKKSGYAWFESYGSLCVEPGKGRKFIILVGRKRPVYALRRSDVESHGGIGDSEIWTKISTSGMFLFVSSHIRSLLDRQPQDLVGTGMHELMRKDSRIEFGRAVEKARKGKIVTCRHDVLNKRGQVLQAETVLYPGDVPEGQKPTFLLAQTKLVKSSTRSNTSSTTGRKSNSTIVGSDSSVAEGAAMPTPSAATETPLSMVSNNRTPTTTNLPAGTTVAVTSAPAQAADSVAGPGQAQGEGQGQEAPQSILQSYANGDDNIFEELKPTRCTSWQFELRQMEKTNRILAEELAQLLSNKKKRKRRRSAGLVRDCANCHTRSTPEWRRGPSGNRDLCNSCGLRWAKQIGRVSPRTSSRGGGNKDDSQSRKLSSPSHLSHQSPLQKEFSADSGGAAASAAAVTAGGVNGPPASGVPATAAPDSADASPSAGVTSTILPTSGSMPPQSQPLLEGGSGLGGCGMEMTSIREETSLE